VIEKIAETNEKLEEKRKSDRSLDESRQRVRITGSTSVGTIEKISRNKVIELWNFQNND
jgi:DNA mismatch repair protein MutS2